MTRVKIKLRLSSVAGKAGTVFYQLSHQKQVKQITTQIHLLPKEWDADGERVYDVTMQTDSRLAAIQRVINNDVVLIEQIIRSYDVQRKVYSLQDVIDAFNISQGTGKVVGFMQHLIEELSAKGKEGTAHNYQCTLTSFTGFLREKDIPFSLLNEPLVMEYDKWLAERGILRNSSSFYMRNLRSMYNKAVVQQGIRQTLPFQNVYTGIDKTSKRAIDEETMSRLLTLDLSFSPRLAYARDLFIFSYCTRGMAFVDVAYLRKENIKNGYICYTRRKTDRQLLVRIEDRVQEIMDRYASRAEGSPYVFPIIHVEDGHKAYSQYQTGLRYYNKCLKEIAALLGDNIILTSYTPRHTWASIARSHNIALAIISEGMGHASDKTTLIYLASLDNALIDKANSELVLSLEQWQKNN